MLAQVLHLLLVGKRGNILSHEHIEHSTPVEEQIAIMLILSRPLIGSVMLLAGINICW